MDYTPLLRPALRAIGCAGVRSGVLPPQSGLRRNDEQKVVRAVVDSKPPRSSPCQERGAAGIAGCGSGHSRGDTTMRFLSLVRVKENTGQKPSEKLMADMSRLINEMTADGTLLDTAGLRPTAEGKRVRSFYGKQKVMDGPFTESKEVIGGYALLNADSMEHALQLTKRFLDVHGDEWEVECELRQIAENC
jgi:hypothetical protein